MAGRIELPVTEYDKLVTDLREVQNKAFKYKTQVDILQEVSNNLRSTLQEVLDTPLLERIFSWGKVRTSSLGTFDNKQS